MMVLVIVVVLVALGLGLRLPGRAIAAMLGILWAGIVIAHLTLPAEHPLPNALGGQPAARHPRGSAEAAHRVGLQATSGEYVGFACVT